MKRNMRSIVAASLVCGMAGLTGMAGAAPILDQSQATGFGSSPGGYPATTVWQGQTVTPTQDYLTSIEINFGFNKQINATIEVYGQTTDNGFSLGTPLGSSSNTIGIDGDTTRQWYTFNFDHLDISNYTDTQGTGRLLFVVKSDSSFAGDSGAQRRIYGSTTDVYAGGIWRYTPNSGTAWVNVGGSSGNMDMAFRVYTDSTVPEPGSLALLGLGAGGLLLKRRRRQ